jgi:hypothetical protein
VANDAPVAAPEREAALDALVVVVAVPHVGDDDPVRILDDVPTQVDGLHLAADEALLLRLLLLRSLSARCADELGRRRRGAIAEESTDAWLAPLRLRGSLSLRRSSWRLLRIRAGGLWLDAGLRLIDAAGPVDAPALEVRSRMRGDDATKSLRHGDGGG